MHMLTFVATLNLDSVEFTITTIIVKHAIGWLMYAKTVMDMDKRLINVLLSAQMDARPWAADVQVTPPNQLA
eukprot:1379668-Karenia_brevis.AAC.1